MNRFLDSDTCCEKVLISGMGALNKLHEDKLGVYQFLGSSNKRSVHKMINKNYYLSWTDLYSNPKKFAWVVNISLFGIYKKGWICIPLIFWIYCISNISNLIGVRGPLKWSRLLFGRNLQLDMSRKVLF